MSLINDALKKAQQQRADATATPPGAPAVPAPAVPKPPAAGGTPVATPAPVAPPPAITRPPSAISYLAKTPPAARPTAPSSIRYPATSPAKPASSKTLWLCLGGIALVIVSVGVTMLLVQPPAQPVVAAKPAPVAPAPDVATRTVPPQAVATSPAPEPAAGPVVQTAPEPVPAVSFPATRPAPSPAPAVAIASPAEPAPAVQPPAATAAATAQAALPPLYTPRAPAPVNPSVRVQNFIDRLRVTGIRTSDTGSRVILNYRMFSVGDTVDNGLELKLVKVEEGVLTFADSTGKTYIKLFQ